VSRIPGALESLLHATEDPSRDRAWAAFLEEYSPIILRAARSLGGDDDARMDRYAFVIDQLQRDNFRRLREYAADGRGQFTTWLVIVVRRLCLDEHRHRYGRLQGKDEASRDRHAMRRQLLDLVSSELDLGELDVAGPDDPDANLRGRQLRDALEQAVASLETRDRLLLRLRFEDGRSVPDVARILRFPSVGGAYRRLESILGTLRARLTAAGVRDSQP
jgi:RNA polymerase sigma factor (sigma-70 family)